MIARLFKIVRARIDHERRARHIKRQIADARARHKPVKHLQASLRDLRHSDLGGAR